ncbi:hypothetical protein I4U23_001928 [Adineta vaga]|nr:hypothetical protein I4U23_001928 [Adineta vaga]
MTSSNKFLEHFRNLQAGESEKAGAAEILAYLNGDLSFQEYEKRVREVNTDFSNVSVGKVLDTRETEIVDIDKLIDELSDIDDISGLSSSSSENSEESQQETESSKKKKTENESKTKRRRRKKPQESDDEDDSNDDNDEKIMDPNEMRNKMVRHLEEMRLANQKRKRKRSEKSKRSTARKRPATTTEKVPKSRLNQEYQALMGEANMAYVHGDIPKALRICQEVITNVPNAAEPYLTIARIYEDQNEHEKAFEMNFFAAHCQRSKDLWTRMLAECQQRQANDLITTCYNHSKFSFIIMIESFDSQ